ncbi:MAG: ATP-binding protein, partial [Candidatus Izemoplasmatales bacterium]|nr:ATP-binding protein [Candidatus Izemoplasmatales bacterium]
MKKLTKVRLINWHFFSNETIYIRNNTLITGQNATGKSTIVDAIAFVITAGDQIFNLAANEKSKRDLRGYVKCKLGIDNHEYLREGDTTGHIALEFFDENESSYFTVGAVIDVFGEILPPKVIFYSLEGKMEERLFVSDQGEILTTLTFKKARVAEKVFMTRREAKLSFRSLFGSINETYFSLLPKALAFKPIADVKDFIYHYLLEEKTLDVESIKESIHAYRDLEATLKVIKQKVQELKEMKDLYEDIQKNQEQKVFLEYFLNVIDLESWKAQIEQKSKVLDKINLNRQTNRQMVKEIEDQLEILDERSKELYALLQADAAFKSEEIYDKEILGLTKKIEEQEEIRRYLDRRIEKIKPIIAELKNEHPRKIYEELAKIDFGGIDESGYEKVKLQLLSIQKELDTIQGDNTKESGRLEEARRNLVTEINDIYQTLKDLENHKVRYQPMIMRLKEKIEEGLKERFGAEISVHVLAELLEVKDPKWQDTVEDYLGQQRFNLIVEPRYFDEALQIYNRIKDSQSIYGIGLVNTKKIQHFTTCQDNSLASIIESENVDAVHFINMTIGNLIMVDDVKDLEKHPQAITLSGMVYRSYTVRSLNKNTEKPFIGRKARELQLEKWRAQAVDAKSRYNVIQDQITMISEENKALDALQLNDLSQMISSTTSLSQNKARRKELVEKKKNLPKENLNNIRLEYESIREEIQGYNNNRRKLFEEQGKLSSDEIKAQEDLLPIETRVNQLRQ